MSIRGVDRSRQRRPALDVEDAFVVAPVGGIGNQLFIYAAGFSLAQTKQVPLLIDVSWFEGQTARSLELNKFNHSGTFVTDVFRQSVLNHLPSPMQRVLKIARWNRRLFGSYHELGFTFDERVLTLPPGTHVGGYFQSFKYWEPVADELKNQIVELVQPTDWFRKEMRDASKEEPWVALHIRRGDYLTPHALELHGVLASDYYLRGLKVLDGLLGRLPLRIFSDDYQVAINMGEILQRDCQIVVPPPSSPAIESILVMSESSGVICANSSFSWWGAWLGDRIDRPVVCPRPWFQSPSVDDRDLLPTHWVSIGRA